MSEKLSGAALLDALESGEVRVAERGDDGTWRVNGWVKERILELFRSSPTVAIGEGPGRELWPFVDKQALPPRRFEATDGVRLVPGGSSVRRGAHLGRGVICMPPMYVNVGAFVGAGSMVDSHALVGSCAQVGRNVHLSAAAQLGGVLEPVGALPVVVEDDVFIGGNCGIYEGARVCRAAVLAPGVILTRSVPVFDLVRESVLRASGEQPLVIPPRAIVVPGSRPARGGFAAKHGVALHTPVIVKYRDGSTDAAVALEEALR